MRKRVQMESGRFRLTRCRRLAWKAPWPWGIVDRILTRGVVLAHRSAAGPLASAPRHLSCDWLLDNVSP